MRWREGFARCAEWAATRPDTRLVDVADRECDIHKFMIRAREESPPAGVEPLDWRLLTNRTAVTLAPAAELIQWYGSRWSIEVFFRILKTGCRVEALRLSTLDRLEPALAVSLVIIAWRIQYLTVLGRTTPDLPCNAVLDPAEWRAVYVAIHHRPPSVIPPPLPTMLG